MLFARAQDAETRNTLFEAVCSFARSDLVRAGEFARSQLQLRETRLELEDTKRALNRMWYRTFRGRVYSLLCFLRIVRPAAEPDGDATEQVS